MRVYYRGIVVTFFAFLVSGSFLGCGSGGQNSGSSGVAFSSVPNDSGDGVPGGDSEPSLPGEEIAAPAFTYGPSFNNQDGPGSFTFTPSTELYKINWSQFPTFTTPGNHTVVFGGPFLGQADVSVPALNYGFTHTNSGPTLQCRNNTPVSKRAILWTGVAGAANQPWKTLESPWGNDMAVQQAWWLQYLKAYANKFSDSAGQDVPKVDLLVSDMESIRRTDEKILELKGNPAVPAEISALPDAEFIDLYKRDMAELYDAPHQFALDKGFIGKLGCYGEPTIVRTWWQIVSYTWSQWLNDFNRRNFVLMNYPGGSNWLEQFGPFHDDNHIMAPSAYLFYDYPTTKAQNPNQWNSAGDYLAYTLFQAEVNTQLSPKDSIVFLWLRFHTGGGGPSAGKPIRSHMAHSIPIFLALSGTKGMWLWDYYASGLAQTFNFSTYEYFTYGLYRLSLHAPMFSGNISYYAPTNARDLMANNKTVVRGIINHDLNKLLVAVHNPYAEPLATSVEAVYYNGFLLGNVSVEGLNVKLVEFDLPTSCLGDLNNDGIVDSNDLTLLFTNFNQNGQNLVGDLNNDGTVNGLDVGLLNGNMGCTP